MNVTNLSKIPLEKIIECFLSAFENYYVKMPVDPSYYKKRWKAAKVDFNLSYGFFENDELVAFIIHAVDQRGGILTAYNTGTGVIPSHRGKGLVNIIYDYALKDLSQKGIVKSTLEVITKNDVAVHCYKKVGFEIVKNYRCFGGNITMESKSTFALSEIPLDQVDWNKLPIQQLYSWDFQKETILGVNYRFYHVMHMQEVESFFIFNPETTIVAQFDLLKIREGGWERLMGAISSVSETVRVINVDDRQKLKIQNIQQSGLQPTVDQYEMALNISTPSPK